MKITSIQAVKLQMPQVATPSTTRSASSVTSPQYAMGHPQAESKTPPRRPAWAEEAEVANPMLIP